MATYDTADEALDLLESIAPDALPLPALTAYLDHPDHLLLLDETVHLAYLITHHDAWARPARPRKTAFTVVELTPGEALALPGVRGAVLRWVTFLAGGHGRDEDYSDIDRPVAEEAMAVLREACRLEIAGQYRRLAGGRPSPSGGDLVLAVDRALDAAGGDPEALRLRLARAYHLRVVLDRYTEAFEAEITDFLDLPPWTAGAHAGTAVPGLAPRGRHG